MALKNNYLTNARKNKNDEFYTQYKDIAEEVEKFKSSFKNKVVYCPCDGSKSNFPKYFIDNYSNLKLKGLYWSAYDEDTYYYDGKTQTRVGNPVDITTDDFKVMMKKCDIVCTNPPFSLFVGFINDMVEANVDFLVIGSQNTITCKDVFRHITDSGMTLDYGFKGIAGYFIVPDTYEDFATAGEHKEGMIRVSGVIWYTTLPNDQEKPFIKLTKKYYLEDGTTNDEEYPEYDNFKAISGLNEKCINVDKVKDIPSDYHGYMGVPISFFGKYNPNQFELIQLDHYGPLGNLDNVVNGKQVYRRIYVKLK